MSCPIKPLAFSTSLGPGTKPKTLKKIGDKPPRGKIPPSMDAIGGPSAGARVPSAQPPESPTTLSCVPRAVPPTNQLCFGCTPSVPVFRISFTFHKSRHSIIVYHRVKSEYSFFHTQLPIRSTPRPTALHLRFPRCGQFLLQII